MQSLGLPTTRPWRQFVILVAFVLGFFLLSAVFLKLKKVKMGISRARETDVDRSLDKEKAPSRTSEGFRAVNISLDNYSLDIAKHSIFGKTSKISILKPISTTFQPGILNVIMGPSGSGKTSLLNMMAHRLHSSFDTRYQAAGTMLFGGAIPTDTVVRSVVSYVSQDDDALLPFLTVRETLHFAAALRLPTWMSKRDKIQRAEAVLLKLALSGCADNLIGNELKKGISGGEKRRVTIAIQVLTDPRILLLDEPVSKFPLRILWYCLFNLCSLRAVRHHSNGICVGRNVKLELERELQYYPYVHVLKFMLILLLPQDVWT